MMIVCEKCRLAFDDADQSTICPHDLIMPAEDLERKKAALELVGKMVRFNHQPDGPDYHVRSCNFIGMVGLAELPGDFAPHLFVVMS
jgi:hypothetical protein